ncbi:cobyrinate a,c-diamide synthase [Desulfothermobacter acidiphilus]|uniref:cobyrinate a,c-diamide synthase n=1 Tax=Desulfothermobacter acidiphilus TaxID=1938353 RepID=UPI003F8AA0B6
MKRLVVAGVGSGSGKTTVALALMAAFRQRGLQVQPFKVGPDYIDPSWHALATGRAGRNLDAWLLTERQLLWLFQYGSRGTDIALIEGVMGLYDGWGSTTEGSTAALSKLLRAPVVLVVPAGGMSASAAAVVLGFREMDPEVKLRGVIFNGVGSEYHARLLREAVEERAGVQVLGAIPRRPELELPSRHLGLVPAAENPEGQQYISRLADLARQHLDLEALERLAAEAPPLPYPEEFLPLPCSSRVRVAVARDRAFTFYYPENLELLESMGAELAWFSPCSDPSLPEGSAAVYLGGGFPELLAEELAANRTLREELRLAVAAGMPVYAECGGSIYLGRSLVWEEKEFALVGALPFRTVMEKRRQRLGYAEAEVLTSSPFFRRGERVRGHVFHYSRREGGGEFLPPAFLLRWGRREPEPEGLVHQRTLASYLHLHFLSFPSLPKRIVQAALLYRQEGISRSGAEPS